MSEKILIVDTDKDFLEMLELQLSSHFTVSYALDSKEALKKIEHLGPFAVVVVRLELDGLDGKDVLSTVKKRSPNTAAVLLAEKDNVHLAVEVSQTIRLHSILTKPCPIQTLVNVLESGLQSYRSAVSEKELIETSLRGTVKLLVDMLSLSLPKCLAHSRKMHVEAHRIAVRLRINDPWEASMAALLSHIGCMTVDKAIVQKKFALEQLSSAQSEVFSRQSQVGGELLKNIPRLSPVAEAVRYQYKCFNGQGFPDDDRKGTQIPLISRILKVADDFTTLRESGFGEVQALSTLRQRSFWYDPDVLAALESEIRRIKKGYLLYEVPAQEIRSGMVLAEDLRNSTGIVLIPENHEVTESGKARIDNLAQIHTLVEPIRVLQEAQPR